MKMLDQKLEEMAKTAESRILHEHFFEMSKVI